MPPQKGMSDDKKAKLDAIRAANAARKAAEGGTEEPVAPVAPIAAAPAVTPVATATVAAPAAGAVKAGANMSDDKKAKLEAIRAANAARKGEVVAPAPVAVAPVPVQPTTIAKDAPAPAAAPARSGTRVPTVQQGQRVVEDDRIPVRVYAIRAAVGAVVGLILCLLLASDTHQYLAATIWGLLLGAALGVLVLSWPPVRTTGE